MSTTVIDGDDLRIVPVGFDVAPIPDKSTQVGTLGPTRIGWSGMSGSANISVQYDRLSDDETDLMLMLCSDLPDGRARLIKFSNEPGEPLYATRRLKASVSTGAAQGTWAVRVEFNANLVPI